MGCFKFVLKAAGILVLAVGVLIFLLYIISHEFESTYNGNVSTELYHDSQELLNTINQEFLKCSPYPSYNEENFERVSESIESYGTKYKSSLTDYQEIELYEDMGLIVYDYLQLVDIDYQYEIGSIDHTGYNNHSKIKRDICENYLHNRVYLREKYNFSYEH